MKDPNSLMHKMMNIIIQGLALKKLEGDAKDHHKKGHEMESIFSKQLLNEHYFPWGKIDEINQFSFI